MPKFVSVEEAAALVKDGMSVMIGGFLGCGNPHHIIDELVKRGVKDLTIISNDSPPTGYGLAKLIDNHQVKRLITTHVGLNQNVADQMNAGELVEKSLALLNGYRRGAALLKEDIDEYIMKD